MNRNHLNIKSIEEGQGLGILKFGLERSAVELLLGEPDEKENYSYTEEENDLAESWHYDDLELSLGFDQEEDWRLLTIAVSSTDYRLKDLSIIGLTKEQLKHELESKGITDLAYEDWSTEESPSHELLTSDSLRINFWFDEHHLSEVQWGPLFIDDETIDWPDLK